MPFFPELTRDIFPRNRRRLGRCRPPVLRPRYTAFFDGACDPNPGGAASFGVVIFEGNGRICERSSRYIPPEGREHETSNNVAEYRGFIAVLAYFIEMNKTKESILIRGDAKLVIEQMFGNMKAKRGLYLPHAHEAAQLLRQFTDINGKWIPRADNTIADTLANKALKRPIRANEHARRS